MTMNKEKKRVPELRFPGFEGEWVTKTLEEVSRNVAYGMNAAATTFDGENQYLRITDIDEDSRTFLPNPLSSPEGEISEKFILKKGDIVFARTGASVGKSYLYNENDGKLLFAGFLIRFNIHKANPYFIFLQTFLEAYNKWVLVYSMRSGQPGLNAEEYKQLAINLPQPEEQQKIALFLTSIDTRIQQLEKKRTLLEQYKKGVMQRIFKQEIRFTPALSGVEVDKDGKEFPEWEEKRLEEIGETINGLTGKTKYDFGKGKPYIQYKQIFDSSKINTDNCGLIDIKDGENQNKVQYGDVFFTTSSETQNEIATASVLLDEVEEMYLNSFCFGLRVYKNILYPSFAQFLFRSFSFRKKMFPLAQGSTRYNISKSNFLKVKVELPCLAEQTKIAHFLSAIDKKIAVVEEQIDGSKEWKRGLLQRMFV